jgi:hypothetical protein
MSNRVIARMLVGNALLLLLPSWMAAEDGAALLNRKHVGRVNAVDLRGNRLIIEGMFHDRSFRDIPVILEPDAPVSNPDPMNRTRAATRREIRPGYYVALECAESGKRHTARTVTITSTDAEERLQRALVKARRGAPPGLRGTGSGPR